MPQPIIRREQAILDLEKIVDTLAGNNPAAARRFLAALDRALDQLARAPEFANPCKLSSPELAALRYRIVKGFRNYLIVYRPLPTGIEVLRVLHAAQNWQAALATDPGDPP